MYKKYEEHFLNTYNSSAKKYRSFPVHVYIVAKWAEKILADHPEADRDVVMIGSWFHDLGHFVGNSEDHAVGSEKEAVRFLEQEKASKELIEKVAHVVRAHRNLDVKPETIEAKIVAAADSASHITAEVYPYFMSQHGKEETLAKLERDFKDLTPFPKIMEQLRPLYNAWKELIKNFPEDFFSYIQKEI